MRSSLTPGTEKKAAVKTSNIGIETCITLETLILETEASPKLTKRSKNYVTDRYLENISIFFFFFKFSHGSISFVREGTKEEE